ncbi:MDR family MFS transporter [Metaplanococcus flavidus]|uniref:MDR family MFS transporter n=1 Tax=Metaplanococcus flavidus TaxID=569883 RepID=A0ABW3LFL0_9BACL
MRTSLSILLLSAFLMNLAGFAVISFLAVYLSNTLHYSAAQTGTILSIMILSSRGLPLLTGILGDKYGYKKLMGVGLVTRGTGFILLAFAPSFFWTAIAALLVGIGTACYEPSALAFFSSEPHEKKRKEAFTYLNFALNGGAIVGPLLGGLLLLFDPRYPFLISGLVFFFLFFIQLSMIQEKRTPNLIQRSIRSDLSQLFSNKSYLYYCFSMIFFWFMFAQLTVAIPLHMFVISKSESLVALTITVNALSGLLLMLLFRKLFLSVHSFRLIKVGMLVMASSFLFISFSSSPYWLLVCIVVFTIGETLVLPSSDIAISEFTNGNSPGIYYGFFELSFALGATLGNYTGAYFINDSSTTFWPWTIFFIIGLVGSILVGRLKVLERTKELSEHFQHQS